MLLAWFRALILTALCAGLLAGAAMAVAHQFVAAPLIAEAERFESPGHGHGDAAAHDPARAARTVAADLLAGVSFALLLAAAMVARGRPLSASRGILWGGAGFIAFVAAPSLGLPPELPGHEAAPLLARQLWWLGTVGATALGLALLAFRRQALPMLAGAVLILLPHVIGAPRPETLGGMAPAELEEAFVFTSLATLLMFWLLLGLACAWCLRRFAPRLTS